MIHFLIKVANQNFFDDDDNDDDVKGKNFFNRQWLIFIIYQNKCAKYEEYFLKIQNKIFYYRYHRSDCNFKFRQ